MLKVLVIEADEASAELARRGWVALGFEVITFGAEGLGCFQSPGKV